ncbi:MAG TPA: non-ribosomal peptide synthetase, partial [Chthoniobacterales bacterium]|nr:non-ribosomal peptide synthetase [Chthoniobacterales bacterium]
FEAHAARQPEATAVLFGNAQFSYRELNGRANQLARYLIEAGVGAESRLAVCLKPSLEITLSLLAILKAGGTYVPIDPNDPADRIATILADVSPTIILTQSALEPNLVAAAPFFFFDRDWNRLHSFSEENLELEIDHEHCAYIVYTSGTTGRPKGVMASHRNLSHYVLAARDCYDFNAEDVMCAVARFTFSISLFELLTPLAAGGATLILARDEVLDFKRMAGVLERVTIIHASPSWWRKLLSYANANGRAIFEQVRHASSGGDKVPGDLLEMLKSTFPKAEIFVIYGCTELSCMGCTYPALRDRTETKAWLGRPFANVEARLFDADRKVVPDGAEGEIYIAGPGVTKGYLNLPKLTAEKFVAIDSKRFYRTGDLGRWENANLQMTGRVDFQIQLRGIRIEPGEIEAHLRQAPGMRDAVVVARELGTSEKSLVAYVVLEPENDVAPVREFLRAKLPDYMVPAAFVKLDAIPVNSNQKVDRRALPAPTSKNLALEQTIVPPRNDLEKELVAIWEDSLGIRPLGTQHSFFELGGDSLQAVQIVMQIEERWNKALPITVLLEAKSIEALAAIIREAGKDFTGENSNREIVTLRRGGTRPPIFCLQGVWIYQEMAQYMDGDQPVYGVFLEEEVQLIKTRQYDPVNSVFATIP